jgi:adenylosuccinate lyase
MEKQLKDYAHLYFGCDLYAPNGKVLKVYEVYKELFYMVLADGYKLILRSLSDMTEEEQFEIAEILGIIQVEHFIEAWINKRTYSISIHIMAELTNTLRKMGFDIDGLIESGLAIDKTTIK